MSRINAKIMLKFASIFIFLASILMYILWFTFKFQTTPIIIISSAICANAITIILIFYLISRKPRKYKIFVLINIFAIMLITLFAFALPTTGISKYTKDTIIEYYGLVEVSGGGGYPATYIIPIDNDGSVSTEQIRSYYGGLHIKYLQGVITKNDDLVGKKVFIIYESNKFNPISTMTVFELDSSFDTTKRAKDQGYRGKGLPIIDVLVSPE